MRLCKIHVAISQTQKSKAMKK